jgi:transketolase
MKLRRGDPKWDGRDRFTIGKGHAAVGLFPIYADLGFFPKEWLDDYTRLGSPLGDHPDMRKVPGVDFSSGSIGHALSNAIGITLAQRWTGKDYTVFCMMGDGEMQEGRSGRPRSSPPRTSSAESDRHHRPQRLPARRPCR